MEHLIIKIEQNRQLNMEGYFKKKAVSEIL